MSNALIAAPLVFTFARGVKQIRHGHSHLPRALFARRESDGPEVERHVTAGLRAKSPSRESPFKREFFGALILLLECNLRIRL